MRAYPYRFHVALDGNGLNGLEGLAGVCQFLFDPADNAYAWKIAYFDGIAGGHAISLNPGGSLGFLGNTGQHLLIYDGADSRELARQSTLSFETNDTSLRGSTHAVWLNEHEFITAIGDHFYRFDARRLAEGVKLGPHRVKLPHALKRSASGRYLVYGSMDHPRQGEAREVGIYDLQTGEARRVELPATCWHVVADPARDIFYALSFRVLPQEGRDWHEWAMAFLKEYAFEIDAVTGSVLRHWAAGREVPAHINSDVTLSKGELIFCNGASQSIIMIEREGLARWRMIDERPDVSTVLSQRKAVGAQIADALTRGNVLHESRHFLSALRISRWAVLDSVYACQLSADQRLLFTANRGLNHITVYDYPANTLRLRVAMPPLQDFVALSPGGDPRLGFHHGALVG
ncbi:hypothetical protein H5407_05770 [Mitsuaria sp. WAJ17]|uniref:hypothetical protein n=1 Tax=Mitsuaria sp. WAJ17 TaxID=2761452 RepID=UPI0015FF1831|nr:hypothetical protein [Mitsuaria sp. WAJ17]MBB2484731.1 hypothetical protein [Mitsuaria sp. WAJ17]